MMDNLISQIKRNNRDLKEAEIKGLLYLLLNEENLTNSSLITLTGLPKETLRHFKKSIAPFLKDPQGDAVLLNEKGREVFSDLEILPYNWSLGDRLDFNSQNEYEKFSTKIGDIKEKYSPKPKREYDQFLATNKTSYLKARILMEKGLVGDKSIAFLGDDDLNSLCLAALDRTYRNISVFDIDDEILSSIKECSENEGFENIETVEYDVRNELENRYVGKFDVVVFDPPYTKNGVALFLERALEFLGKVNDFEGKYVFMYFGNSFKSPEKILKIQDIINRFGFSIEDRIEKFSRYNGAESIGSSSSLYILKANKFTRSLKLNVKCIYTYEKISEENFPYVDHLVFKIFDVKKDLLMSKSRLMGAVEELCKIHKLRVMEKVVTEFKGGGMTLSFVLANSNLTVHTWPEHKALHVDLVTCSPIYNKDGLIDTLIEKFNTSKIEINYIE
jgi:predicted methyltransferase